MTTPAGDAGGGRIERAVLAAGGLVAAAGALVAGVAIAGVRGAFAVLALAAAFGLGVSAGPAWRRLRGAGRGAAGAPGAGPHHHRRPRRPRRQSPAEARRDCRQSLVSVRSMGRVAEQVAGGDSASFVVLDVALALVDLLDLRDCRYEPASGESGRPVLRHGGELEYRGVRWSPTQIGLPEKGFDLPLVARGHLVARFVCLPGPRRPVPEDRVLAALALVDQAASAQLIERVA
jgi:hypothetical protein